MNFCQMILILVMCCSVSFCKKDDDATVVADIQETAQQVGDMMASIDESGGMSGGFAMLNSHKKSLARFLPEESKALLFEGWLLPRAEAELCSIATTFGSCSSSSKTITRNFQDCSIGGFLTLSGTVVLTYNKSTCSLSADNDTVVRVPDFTITGRRGGSLAVSKTALIGQRLTKVSATSFTFTSDGIRRVITSSANATLFDFTTTTTGSSGLSITGASRAGRTIDSGTIRVLNNQTDISCDFTPTAVTYDTTCNCAVSGSWSGICSDNITSSIAITGCGTADFAIGTQSEPVSFDRCYSL